MIELKNGDDIAMKILITTDVFAPAVNGVVTSVLNLCTQLKKIGNDVRILTLSNNKYSYKEKNVYYIKSFGINIYSNTRATVHFHDKYIKEILDWEPDIIHSQCEFFTFIFAKNIAKKLNIPIVHTYHTMYEYYTHYFTRHKKFGKKVVSMASKIVLSNVNTVIAPTQKVNDILKNYGVKNRIVTVPTGIELKKFKREDTDNEIEALKENLGIEKDSKVLVTIGRLAKEKNIDELLKNMKELIKSNKKIMLLIVGDGPYRHELENKVSEENLKNNVIFTGMIAPENIYKYYQIGDIFVSASESETQGLTYLESLASGLPTVCKKDECLNNVIIDDYNGFLYENSNEYIEKLKLILNDHKLYTTMSNNAYKIAAKYSTENFGKQIESVYLNEIVPGSLYIQIQSKYYKESMVKTY